MYFEEYTDRQKLFELAELSCRYNALSKHIDTNMKFTQEGKHILRKLNAGNIFDVIEISSMVNKLLSCLITDDD